MNIIISPVTMQDINVLQDLSIETFSETFGQQNPPEDLELYLEKAFNPQQLTKEIMDSNTNFYFIFQEALLAGYIKLKNASLPEHSFLGKALEVERIYVRKAYQHLGLGKHLLDFASEEAQRTHKEYLWLSVWEHNPTAYGFYKSQGYVECGSRHFHLGTLAQTDLIMKKEIRRTIMQTVTVDKNFWELFPEAQLYTLVVNNMNNHAHDLAPYQDLLKEAFKASEKFLVEDDFKENFVISEWRDIFTQFKKKKGARSSIEALLKRVTQGKELAPINPLVDIYNSISLRYGVPCGGEDLDKINGDLHLGLAKGGEDFYPLGAQKSEPALPQEIIYYDLDGAICRSLNWREAQRTMLTEETTNAILVIEAVTPSQQERSLEAIQELQAKIKDMLGVESELQIISNT
ncbi:GNAT family N-acetyltransferase [Lactococcus petauri]|uniref:B3/B4 domain-containing protein (DNA/RNA-binding domain of Phe-tRNA-synthetase) n=2 Tax=Streptococcaceae TaxID=1300 RepID=A0A1I4HY78_9LACT|nr:GNAT family N-acetyltransferase [Lactococcus petauri]SFL47078.1 B3/B4 domain-containing protein (DNA/RNA-binding domain of Phe-tRNA-synthetase) [Lactococcus garvieae]